MFDRLFQFIREGVKTAILGGIEDAHDELAAKIETGEPLALEESTNGQTTTKTTTRKKSATSKR